jgi:hypothetical protein
MKSSRGLVLLVVISLLVSAVGLGIVVGMSGMKMGSALLVALFFVLGALPGAIAVLLSAQKPRVASPPSRD